MPFNREYVRDNGDYVISINRDRTGPPKPVSSTGTVKEVDGSIVADSAAIAIAPPTPINVDLPSPNEPLVGKDGRINHHWWRFLNQLYLRTGGVTDAINTVPTSLLGAGSAASVAFTGAAPTLRIDEITVMSLGSIAISGLVGEPALSNPVEAPSAGSVAITGYAPEIP
jgi:hypothetical protein